MSAFSPALATLLDRYGPELGLTPESLPSSYVHCHGHTFHSHGDALPDPIELAKRAKTLGMTALAVTDHRVGYGLLDVYLACQKAGIRPLLGSELNESEDRHVKSHAERKAKGIKSNHLPIIAMDYTGYQNLCQILSDAATNGLYIGPGGHFEEASLSWIRAKGFGKRMIALTGCISGRMARLLLEDGDMEAARVWLKELQETFEQVYIELQFHQNPAQQRLNLMLLRLHAETGVPMVATRDYHYILPEDGRLHDVYVACVSGWREGYDSHDYWFCPATEMYEWAATHEDYLAVCQELNLNPFTPITTSRQLADQVDIQIPTGTSLMPHFIVPAPHTEITYLRLLCLQALEQHLLTGDLSASPTTYIERLEWELQVICDRGSAGYMLIPWEICEWCRNNEIVLGPGRGSAAGSLVAFLLRIVMLDPLRYGLLFQRFLSPDRNDEPDIDLDMAGAHRGRVIRHIVDLWGEQYVAQIGTHGTLAVKQATQDLGKAMGLTDQEVKALTKPLPPKWPDQGDLTFQKLQEIQKEEPDPAIIGDLDETTIRDLRDLAAVYWAGIEAVAGLPETIARVTGAKKSVGIHASGVAICPTSIATFIPLTGVPNAAVIPVTQYDMDGLTKLGVLKMDILGINTLSVIDLCLKLVNETEGKVINLMAIPLDLPEVFQSTYARGRTHGVFQGGNAMRQIATKMKPSSFDELIDLLALARPGPMDAEDENGNTLVDIYIANKIKLLQGDLIVMPHPVLTDLLLPTKGVWVYQEQLMIGSQILAGFTPGAQDTLRSATAKKKPELQQALRYVFVYGSQKAYPLIQARIEELRTAGVELKKLEEWEKALKQVAQMSSLVPGGMARGYTEAFLSDIYDQWLKFAGYSFNKSHSASYALVSYWTAYLKTFFPAQFMCALLTAESDKPKKTTANLQEVRRMGLTLLAPSVTESGRDFTLTRMVEGRLAILYGLLGVKGLGEKAVDEILLSRKLQTLAERDVLKLTDVVLEDRLAELMAGRLSENYTSVADFFTRINARVINRGVMATLIKIGAFDCFDDNRFRVWNQYHFELRTDTKKKREEYEHYNEEDWQPEYAWSWERNLTGQYISGHPLMDLPSVFWEDVPHQAPVEIGGILLTDGFREFNDKNKNSMAMGRFETVSGLTLSFAVFSRDWPKVMELFVAGAVLILRGRRDAVRDSLIVTSATKGTRRHARKARPTEEGGACAPPVIVADPMADLDLEEDLV